MMSWAFAWLVVGCGAGASPPAHASPAPTGEPSTSDHRATTDEPRAPTSGEPGARAADVRVTTLVGVQGAFCILAEDRAVHCGVGDGPMRATGLTHVDEIVGSDVRFCARADRDVHCWEPSRVPRAVPVLEGAIAIALSGDTVCAALENGAVRCDGLSPAITTESTVTDAIDVALTGDVPPTVCTLSREGIVRCEGCQWDWAAFRLRRALAVTRTDGMRCTRQPEESSVTGAAALDWTSSGGFRARGPADDFVVGASTGVAICSEPGCRAGEYVITAERAVAHRTNEGDVVVAPATASETPVRVTHPLGPVPQLEVPGWPYVLYSDGRVGTVTGDFSYRLVAGIPPVTELTTAGDVAAVRVGGQVWQLANEGPERVLDLEPARAIAGALHALCAVLEDGSVSCLARSGNGHACREQRDDLVDVEVSFQRSCVLTREGTALCGIGQPCDGHLQPVMDGIASLERRGSEGIVLVDAAGSVVATYPARARERSTWCHGAPCACVPEDIDWDCGAHPASDARYEGVVRAVGWYALLADGTLLRVPLQDPEVVRYPPPPIAAATPP